MKAELNTELFRAIMSMDIKNLNDEDKRELLNIFNFTRNAAIRDQIALMFAETNYNEAVPFIIEKINDGEVFNHTGTLVYSLLELDSKQYFIDLIKIICEQAYESKAMAFSIVSKLTPSIQNTDLDKALKLLHDYKAKIDNSGISDDDTINIINSTITVLNNKI